MISFIASIFFGIGFLVAFYHIFTFCFSLSDKFRESRERRQAHEKRLVTLLESINQKLNAKP